MDDITCVVGFFNQKTMQAKKEHVLKAEPNTGNGANEVEKVDVDVDGEAILAQIDIQD